jgi:hypothetical protein
MRRIILSSLAIILTISFSFGQSVVPSVVNSSGGSFNDPNYYFRFDWSVGEMTLVNQMQSNDGLYILTNGLLQPYTNTPGSINNTGSFDATEIQVFPNPASKYVEIDFNTRQQGRVKFILYDNLGQKIYDRVFLSYGLDRVERINIETLASGVYMLYIQLDPIVGSHTKKGAFKIVKTK